MSFFIPHRFPAFATHAKLVPRPLQSGGSVLIQGSHGTEALIGSLGGGTIVAAPINAHTPLQLVIHQTVPYTTATSDPMAIPLKLLFTRFPPFIEAIVQRIQNYFSTYNHVGNENYPVSPPQNEPLVTTSTATTPAPTSTATTGTSSAPTSKVTTATTPVPTSTATTKTPIAPILHPVPTNAESQTGNSFYGDPNNYDTL
jgi:hypothetical protein